MRVRIIVVLIVLAASACCAGPIAMFTPEKSSGIDIVTPTDGQWEYKLIDGRKAVSLKQGTTPASSYIYFKLDAEARKNAGADIWLVTDFFDKGIGVVGTQFNGEKSPYDGAPGFLLLDTKKWQRALIHLTAAKLAGAQNEGADLRFSCSGSLAISRVEVYSSDPKLALPTNKERAMKNLSQIPKPRGMFYTFGNDVDESSDTLCR